MVYLKENYKKILPYAGIFFVLFIGSGLVKIPVGSVWFYVIKFGIIAAVMGIGVSAWWKAKKNNLPPTDYLKLALFVPFTIDFHVYYTFIFLTIVLFNKKLLLPWNSPLKPIYLLFIWGFISYIINQFIQINPLSFPLFILSFFLPFVFFALMFNNCSKIIWHTLLQFYVRINWIIIFIIFTQTIYWWDLHPDFRNGGVSEPHTAGAYLSISILLLIYMHFKQIRMKKSDVYFIPLALVAMFFIDVKYILLFLFISFMFAIIYLFKNYKKYRVRGISLILVILILWIGILDMRLYNSILAFEGQNYKISSLISEFHHSTKYKLFYGYYRLIMEHPLLSIVGCGGGTFLSRAAYLNSPEYHDQLNTDNITFNILKPVKTFPYKINSWVREKYANGSDYFIQRYGQSTLTDWRSSLLNGLFELGIIGIILIFTFLFRLLEYKNVVKEYLVLLPIIGFFGMMFVLDLWYELPRYRFIQDSVLGIIFSFQNKVK